MNFAGEMSGNHNLYISVDGLELNSVASTTLNPFKITSDLSIKTSHHVLAKHSEFSNSDKEISLQSNVNFDNHSAKLYAAVDKSFEGGRLKYNQDELINFAVNLGNFGGDLSIEILPIEFAMQMEANTSPMSLKMTGSLAGTPGKLMIDSGNFIFVIGESLKFNGKILEGNVILQLHFLDGEYALSFARNHLDFELFLNNEELLGVHKLSVRNPPNLQLTYQGLLFDIYRVDNFAAEISMNSFMPESVVFEGLVLGEPISLQQNARKTMAVLLIGENKLQVTYPSGKYEILLQLPATETDLKLDVISPSVQEIEILLSGHIVHVPVRFELNLPVMLLRADIEKIFTFSAEMTNQAQIKLNIAEQGAYSFVYSLENSDVAVKILDAIIGSINFNYIDQTAGKKNRQL